MSSFRGDAEGCPNSESVGFSRLPICHQLERLSGFRMSKPGVLWLDTALHHVPKRFLIFKGAELRVFLGSRDFSVFDINTR